MHNFEVKYAARGAGTVSEIVEAMHQTAVRNLIKAKLPRQTVIIYSVRQIDCGSAGARSYS